MKYGPIICDPGSKEARALVGKKVIGGCDFSLLKHNPEYHTPTTLSHISISNAPFLTDYDSFFFIREVIEKKPVYRPYKDTDEMVEDYRGRADLRSDNLSMPMIWLKHCVSRNTMLITKFADKYVSIEGVSSRNMQELFDDYTYIDDTPVGKEIKE